MAVLFADDFSGFGGNTGLMLNGLYSQISNGLSIVADPDPTATGMVAKFSGDADNNAVQLRRPFAKGTVPVCGAAFRLWLSALPADNQGKTHHIDFRDAANNVMAALNVLSTGVMQVMLNNDPNNVFASPVPVVTANAWTHIEMKYTASADGTAVGFEVRVQGVTVLSGVGKAGSAGNVGQVAQYRANIAGDPSSYMKDFVVWDNSGAHNNDFLGTVSVLSMFTDGDVSLNWTPSTGATGWNLLDQVPPNDANDYITAATPPPAPAEFTLQDLPLNVSAVKALITQVRARKSDGGDGNLQTALLSEGQEIDGVNRPITTAYTYYEDVFETDPATGGSWTPASADAAELKINRTA